jgi:hypothetical protein
VGTSSNKAFFKVKLGIFTVDFVISIPKIPMSTRTGGG